jgi:hypothetical protein
MKIIDGLKLPAGHRNRVEIPNCKRRQLPDFFKQMGYKVGVEIGVYKGDFTRWLLKRGAKIYAVDPWLAYPDYGHPKVHFQARQDVIYRSAKKRLAPFGDRCEIIRKTSMEAVKDFEDDSIDFVYIDGHHGFKYVAEDIYEWSKKVRKGGIISGHDYALRKFKNDDPWTLQVKFVVDAYTQAFRIKKWYVLGRREVRAGEHRDQFRSWMWFNQ